MLWNIAWRRVKDGWLKELNEKPKLSMLKMLVDCGAESSCAYVKSKSERRIWMKLRGGTAPLQIEMGRWQGIRREERLCKQCDSGVVGDVYHWMVECNAFGSAREPLLELMENLDDGFNQKTKQQKTIHPSCMFPLPCNY